MGKMIAGYRKTVLGLAAMASLLSAAPARASNEGDMTFYYNYVVSYTKSAIADIQHAETLNTIQEQCSYLRKADGELKEADRFAVKLTNVDQYYNSINYSLYVRVLGDLSSIEGELGTMLRQCAAQDF